MIVVVGSRHDPVAAQLVERWPQARWCDAGDLVAPGWRWPAPGAPDAERCWVIEGAVVPDAAITGVLIRRAAVHPDELVGTHPDDRAYLAAEALAMLVYVAATTSAVVVNPVGDGTLGVDALRPERWMAVAAGLGVPVAPLRLARDRSAGMITHGGRPETYVEVVAGAPSTTGRLGEQAVKVAAALGLAWVVAGFDAAGRMCTLSSAPAPSPAAAERLAAVLADAEAGDS